MPESNGDTPPNPLLDEVLIGLGYAARTGGGVVLKPHLVRTLNGYIETLQRIAIAAAMQGVQIGAKEENREPA